MKYQYNDDNGKLINRKILITDKRTTEPIIFLKRNAPESTSERTLAALRDVTSQSSLP